MISFPTLYQSLYFKIGENLKFVIFQKPAFDKLAKKIAYNINKFIILF